MQPSVQNVLEVLMTLCFWMLRACACPFQRNHTQCFNFSSTFHCRAQTYQTAIVVLCFPSQPPKLGYRTCWRSALSMRSMIRQITSTMMATRQMLDRQGLCCVVASAWALVLIISYAGVTHFPTEVAHVWRISLRTLLLLAACANKQLLIQSWFP